MQETLKRKEYKTWDEAFKGLAPAVRQRSVRCADYTRVIFLKAASMGFGKKNPAFEGRIRGAYADVAYKCGLYHQLGKALVPLEYQLYSKNFTKEEEAVYKKYTADGEALIAALQEEEQLKKNRARGKVKSIREAENIPSLMIREAAKSHMERFDGSGFPEGLKGDEISPIAQITGLAKALDEASSLVKSESPFDEALEYIYSKEGVFWSAELIKVLRKCEEECRGVYEKYIHYTLTIPRTVPLVLKRENRPLGLNFRLMESSKKDGFEKGCEATAWFAHLAADNENSDEKEDISNFFKRTDLTAPVWEYLLYEAADAIVRINNCRLDIPCVIFNIHEEFYRLKSQLKTLNRLLEYEEIKKESLILTIPESFVKNASKTNLETVILYLRNGFNLMLDDADIYAEDFEHYLEFGFKYVRPDVRFNMESEAKDSMVVLRSKGFEFIGKGADSEEILNWQLDSGMLFASGTYTGLPMNEEDFVRDCLLKERG